MKTIIAGSRSITNMAMIEKAVGLSGWRERITEVVSGGAWGADRLGEQWAKRNGIPVTRFPADWNRHGKSAGAIRNKEMAAYAEALIAIWNLGSRGTRHMVETMTSLHKPTCVMKLPEGALWLYDSGLEGTKTLG